MIWSRWVVVLVKDLVGERKWRSENRFNFFYRPHLCFYNSRQQTDLHTRDEQSSHQSSWSCGTMLELRAHVCSGTLLDPRPKTATLVSPGVSRSSGTNQILCLRLRLGHNPRQARIRSGPASETDRRGTELGNLSWAVVSARLRWKMYRAKQAEINHSSGSKQNWRSLAKMFAQRLGMPIYTLVSPCRSHHSATNRKNHSFRILTPAGLAESRSLASCRTSFVCSHGGGYRAFHGVTGIEERRELAWS